MTQGPRQPPLIDMAPDGTFRSPSPGQRAPLSFKLLLGATVVAVVAGALTLAALAVWVAALLLPVVIVAGFVAWATLRYRRWRRGGVPAQRMPYPR